MMYRTTLHSTTGESPAELMFRRKLRTRIHGMEDFLVDREMHDRDIEAKERGKRYADQKRGARESDMKAGDTVLRKQDRTNKLIPTFKPETFRVLNKAGNSVAVESPDGVQYKRNSTHVKTFLERDSSPENHPSVSTPSSEKPDETKLPSQGDGISKPLEETSIQAAIENTADSEPRDTAMHRSTYPASIPLGTDHLQL